MLHLTRRYPTIQEAVRRAIGAIVLLGLAAPLSARAGDPYSVPGYVYVSPAPGTHYHRTFTNVIIRPGGLVDPGSLGDLTTVRLSAEISGDHPGRIRLSDDGRTILFRPLQPFLAIEHVTCRVTGIRMLDGSEAPDAIFDFWTGGTGEKSLTVADLIPEDEAVIGDASAGAADTLALLTGAVYGVPAPGRLFLTDLAVTDFRVPSNLMVARNSGMLADVRSTPHAAYNYTLQPDGRRTYFDTAARAYFALDDSGAVVDSFRCGNGYRTDGHDLVFLPNGHALLMAYDTQSVDMSAVVPGGRPYASVTGLVIQELDRERDVVYQWRSWDTIDITEATRVPLTVQLIDYVHGNSMEATPDGAMLVSCRHLDAVLKISLETGAIVWRLGGSKNQFDFVGDPERFTYQHDARLLPDGHLTLFDNGNGHTPPHSRAVEYALDESAMTATLVWQYRPVPDVFAWALGSVQRLPNGNTLVGWGTAPGPAATEVAPDGTVMSELWLAPGRVSYRVLRFEWPPALPADVTPRPSIYVPEGQEQWAKFVVESESFDVDRIDPSSVRLEGTLAPDPDAVEIGDGNDNERPDMVLRFDMAALERMLHEGVNGVEVEGSLTGGGLFRGYALVTLRDTRGPDASAAGAAGASIGSRIPAGGGAPFAVFDVQGRLVRRGRAASGAGAAAWDGRGDDGRRLPSGVYFVRPLEAAPGAKPGPARKVILIR